jgi:hypothetical protein
MRGLVIKVNGTKVETTYLQLLEDDQFVPMRDAYSDGDVKVELIAGMGHRPPDSSEPEDGSSRADAVSGWYVICNGRVVLGADRSFNTGWGLNDFPMWHRQYSGFVGIAFFSSREPTLLPMTTTKRSVDVSSGVYRRALPKMQIPTRAWVDYTNKRKTDQSVKQLETAATPREISTINRNPEVRLPTIAPGPLGERVANVLYTVPYKRLRRLAAAFGRRSMSYKDVGEKSFDYAYDMLVDEEEA